ncbi:hypothetical protein ACJJTC_010089 [Scirpophaga incertulas]
MDWKDMLVMLACLTVQCLAMSPWELQDFAHFLRKTSQLETAVEDDDSFDNDEIMSDFGWEQSGKFEGDLILNDKQRIAILEDVAVNTDVLFRNGLRDITKRWPYGEVIYFIKKEHFNNHQIHAIENAMASLAMLSCLRFRPYRVGDYDTVVIQGNKEGCFSQVGYQGGIQVLNLSGRHPVGQGCFRHGTVLHELLHTLGFYHMQSSADRDDNVKIIWENVNQQHWHNFRKYNVSAVSDFDVGYDYSSVMHYNRRAFSINGKSTIVPKQCGAQIGQRIRLSVKDIEKLNLMYCHMNDDEDDKITIKIEAKVRKH